MSLAPIRDAGGLFTQREHRARPSGSVWYRERKETRNSDGTVKKPQYAVTLSRQCLYLCLEALPGVNATFVSLFPPQS